MATTFGFDKRTMAMIDTLKESLGASSKAEVLRRAIALLNLAEQVQSKGGHITLENADGTKSKVLLS